ncbi:MAG: hypothetical protein LBC50_02225 [Candidatus Ancillula sp.]|jgi:phosphate uptake regulator|nr:hypothetical protein [Candidatus Ancillula sp.]
MLKRDIDKLEELDILVDDLVDLVKTSIKSDENNEVSEELVLHIRKTYREIDKTAARLILKGQPVASDLKKILKSIRKADEFRQAFRLSRKLGRKESVANVRKVLLNSVSSS